jgi:hypothetical protein
MIDPDSIIVTDSNLSNEIKIGIVPDYDFETYTDIEDTDSKEYKKFIGDIEHEVRSSFEYKQFINYIRNNMDMNRCAYIVNATNKESFTIRIEIHHYPFTLYDICEIVYNKRVYYNESIEVEMIAKEVMILHYKLMVGLIPLSETVHKLVHNGKIFIPVDNVMGRYDLFMQYYDPFIKPEQKDMVSRMEKYTKEQTSELLNTTILDTNNLSINVKSADFQIPCMDTLGNAMLTQIQTIKDNSYRLPSIHDKILIENKQERKPIEQAVYTLSVEEMKQYL